MLPKIEREKIKILFWAIFAGVIIAAYSLAPQFQLWALRGAARDWTGVYAIHDFDEIQYAAYVESLIDGKPRRNYPFTGVVETPENPLKESLLSVQFTAFYPAAIPARLFGLSASTAMIFLSAIAGFLAGLALFRLFYGLFENAFLSFVGTVAVFSSGMLAAGHGSLVARFFSPDEINKYFYLIDFPFARRAVPLVAFPAFFLFFGSIWKVVSSPENRRSQIRGGALAVLSFAFLVYSYFYLWTTAAAWFGALLLLLLIFRFQDRRKIVFPLILIGFLMFLTLIPYFILLSNRSTAMDSVLLLAQTHRPDLRRIPELVSFAVLFGYAAAAKVFKWIDWRAPKTIFLASFALAAPVVFNQQILTGRTLQPVHYQFYAVNYLSVFAAVSFLFLLLREKKVKPLIFNGALLVLGFAALFLGYSDGQFAVKRARGINDWRNDLYPVARKIKEISASAGAPAIVLAFDFYPYVLWNTKFSLGASDELPALSGQAVLWSLHQDVVSDLTAEASRRRLFKFIYYQNFDEQWLKNELTNGRPELTVGFFGQGRGEYNILTDNPTPVGEEEINSVVEEYKNFRQNFNADAAGEQPQLSFVITHEAAQPDFSTLDRWYERGAGERVGKYTLYAVRLKSSVN